MERGMNSDCLSGCLNGEVKEGRLEPKIFPVQIFHKGTNDTGRVKRIHGRGILRLTNGQVHLLRRAVLLV